MAIEQRRSQGMAFTNIPEVAQDNGMQPYRSERVPASSGIMSTVSAKQLRAAQPAEIPASVSRGGLSKETVDNPFGANSVVTDQNGNPAKLTGRDRLAFAAMDGQIAGQGNSQPAPGVLQNNAPTSADLMSGMRLGGTFGDIMAVRLANGLAKDAWNREQTNINNTVTGMKVGQESRRIDLADAREQREAEQGMTMQPLEMELKKSQIDLNKASAKDKASGGELPSEARLIEYYKSVHGMNNEQARNEVNRAASNPDKFRADTFRFYLKQEQDKAALDPEYQQLSREDLWKQVDLDTQSAFGKQSPAGQGMQAAPAGAAGGMAPLASRDVVAKPLYVVPNNEQAQNQAAVLNTGMAPPVASVPPSEKQAAQGKAIDRATAESIFKEVGGDINKARQLAKERGYSL